MTTNAVRKLPEGQFTTTVYSLMSEGKYQEVIQILEVQLESFPSNRAALSLLGYCYYYLQAFQEASQW